MTRKYAQIYLTIWNDEEFLARSDSAQALYFRLVTSASLNTCGVADWRPKRLAAKACDLTEVRVRESADELRDSGYIVYDDDTEEVLIRTFIKWDGVMKSPNLAVALEREFGGIASLALRAVVLDEIRKLHDQQPELKGWFKVPKLLEKANETLRVPLPQPLPQPHRVGDPISLNPQPVPSAPDQIEAGRAARLVTEWIDHCKVRPPRSVIGKVRAELESLFEDDIPFDMVRAGLARWTERGLAPSVLPSVVNEVANGTPRIFGKAVAPVVDPAANAPCIPVEELQGAW